MVILLYGQDDFRSKLKLKEIIDQHQKVRGGGLNLSIIDFKESRFNDLREKMETIPIFADKRFIIVLNLLGNQDLSREVLGYFERNSQKHEKDTFVFFEKDKFDAANPLFSFLEKTAKVKEFEPLSGRPLSLWLEEEVGKLGGEIDSPALKKLAEISGSDLWFLANEIKKLVTFKNKKKILVEDIESSMEIKAENNIFRTIDAIASSDRKSALKLLNRHLEAGDSAIYLLNMVGYQFRNILVIKDLARRNMSWPLILKTSGLKDFVARKCYSLAGRFSFPRLKNIYSELLAADIKIKTGKISPRQGLELLVSRI